MRKPDEIEFYAAIQAKGWGVFADVVAENIGMDWPHARILLLKWQCEGWWDFDASLRSGWLTDKAPKELVP